MSSFEQGNGASANVSVLQGTTGGTVNFGSVIKSDFTICSATRYTGGSSKMSKLRQQQWQDQWQQLTPGMGAFLVRRSN